MILKAYSFLDVKTGINSAPFFVPHEGLALRAAIDLVHDESTQIGRHPNDFVLYRVGEFDDNTAVMTAVRPVNLGVVSAIAAPRPVPLFETPSEKAAS